MIRNVIIYTALLASVLVIAVSVIWWDSEGTGVLLALFFASAYAIWNDHNNKPKELEL